MKQIIDTARQDPSGSSCKLVTSMKIASFQLKHIDTPIASLSNPWYHRGNGNPIHRIHSRFCRPKRPLRHCRVRAVFCAGTIKVADVGIGAKLASSTSVLRSLTTIILRTIAPRSRLPSILEQIFADAQMKFAGISLAGNLADELSRWQVLAGYEQIHLHFHMFFVFSLSLRLILILCPLCRTRSKMRMLWCSYSANIQRHGCRCCITTLPYTITRNTNTKVALLIP